MATINWSSSLPQYVLRSNYSRNPKNNTIFTSMDVGPSKVRRRSTSTTDIVSISIAVDIDELQTFETFYKTTLGYGVETFNFPDPENSGSTYEARFNTANDPVYTITPEDETVDFIISFELEKLT